MVDVDLNWLNWFHFLFIEGGLFAILILDVIKMSMPTVFFLAQLGSGNFYP